MNTLYCISLVLCLSVVGCYLINTWFDHLQRQVISRENVQKILQNPDAIDQNTREFNEAHHRLEQWIINHGGTKSRDNPEAQELVMQAHGTYMLMRLAQNKPISDEYTEYLCRAFSDRNE